MKHLDIVLHNTNGNHILKFSLPCYHIVLSNQSNDEIQSQCTTQVFQNTASHLATFSSPFQ